VPDIPCQLFIISIRIRIIQKKTGGCNFLVKNFFWGCPAKNFQMKWTKTPLPWYIPARLNGVGQDGLIRVEQNQTKFV
jgi:hypothetical protein